MDEETLSLLYPGSSLSELTALGETEVKRRFEAVKARIRMRLDGSPIPELQNIKAQVLLMSELENNVLTKLRSRPVNPMQ